MKIQIWAIGRLKSEESAHTHVRAIDDVTSIRPFLQPSFTAQDIISFGHGASDNTALYRF